MGGSPLVEQRFRSIYRERVAACPASAALIERIDRDTTTTLETRTAAVRTGSGEAEGALQVLNSSSTRILRSALSAGSTANEIVARVTPQLAPNRSGPITQALRRLMASISEDGQEVDVAAVAKSEGVTAQELEAAIALV
ncbi:MAG: hypothetical protein Q8P95_05585 [bacterium]|nr:hypothetical protein [bacterium]